MPPEPALNINDGLNNLLIEAHKALAVLDERARHIPNMDLFVSMYVQKEALLSSQIEGTQATLEDILGPLIQAPLIHYQFETIHPFLDGNGRVGRLLIALFLLEKKVIITPALYLSAYLKTNRVECYDRMSAVRETGDFEQWVKFL